MRRVVTVLIIVMVAAVLGACSSAPPATTPTTPAAVPSNQPQQTASTGDTSGDILSPTQTVKPGILISKDASSVPAAVLANVAAKKPMVIFWYDPTTKVANDQVKELNAALRNYKGAIKLVSIDYTVGLTSSAASSTIDPEIQKIELFAASLGINTTPYILFVDQYGRITYRFAGIVDKGLLTREVLRATQ